MVTFAASTPSPPPGIRTPPTPKHGYSDSWEPFSPRKSARISSQQAAARTPSPGSASRPAHHRAKNIKTATALVSPMASPQKKHQPTLDPHRRSSGTLTAEGTANAAAALGLDKTGQRSGTTTISRRAGMLPTPAKTPVKPPTEKNAANIKAFARNLFPPEDEAMPSPKRKRAKKYTGISMDSFAVEEQEDPIEIFTDSHDRVPTVDASAANPFYDNVPAPVPEPSKRRSKRKQVAVPGEGSQTVEEALQREDGMVYVFRGKKIFRKFADQETTQPDEQEELDGELSSTVEPRLSGRLTRSSIKPRLLFPASKAEGALEEEEAVTDVEEEPTLEPEDDIPETPSKRTNRAPKTPGAPRFSAALSPPDTKRTTRAGEKSEEVTPVKGHGKRSPFDSWPRVKDHASSSHKRAGDTLAPAASKRSKT